jgi:hypothetical protein
MFTYIRARLFEKDQIEQYKCPLDRNQIYYPTLTTLRKQAENFEITARRPIAQTRSLEVDEIDFCDILHSATDSGALPEARDITRYLTALFRLKCSSGLRPPGR